MMMKKMGRNITRSDPQVGINAQFVCYLFVCQLITGNKVYLSTSSGLKRHV